MKGSISKSYKFSTIISCKDLQRLNDFIASEYNFLKYKITTIDGAKYETEDFNEILKYDNYNSRKIEQIIISANHAEKEFRFLNDFEIELNDSSRYPDSINYTIRNVSEKEIASYTSQLKDLIMSFKAQSSWIHNIWILLAFNGVMLLIFHFSFLHFFRDKIDETLLYLYPIFISFSIAWISSWVFSKTSTFLYPKTVFCIGKQIDFFDSRKKTRNTILIVIILGLILSIVGSLIVFLITN